MIKTLLNTTSLKANIIANFTGNGWVALISLIFVPIYLKYIGAEGYGLIGIFSSLHSVLMLLDSGLSTTLNKEIARLSVLPNTAQQMRNLVKTLATVYWGVAIFVGLVALGLSPLLAKYWVQPDALSTETITYAFVILSLSLVFQFPAGFYSGGLMGLQRQVLLNILKIFFATLRSVGAVMVLIFVSNSILMFFTWTLIVSLLQALTFKYFLWASLPKSESKPIFVTQELKNNWRFAAGMLSISLTAVLLTQVDKIILSKILSLEQFGYYTVACTLGMMLYQVIAPLTQSYFPKFSSLISIKDSGTLTNVYHQSNQLISVLVCPATLMLIFFSKELIFIWTQNPETVNNTWYVVSAYSLGTGINCLLVIPYLLTLAFGWTKMSFYQNIVLLCIMVPLVIYLAQHFGALGGAISWVIMNGLYFLVTPSLIHHRYLKSEKFYWYWHDCIKIILVSTAIVVAARFLIPINEFSQMFQLMILILVGICTVVTNAFFTRDLRPVMLNMLSRIQKCHVR